MSEDQGFEVVDKRRVRLDAENTAEEGADAATETGATEDAAGAEGATGTAEAQAPSEPEGATPPGGSGGTAGQTESPGTAGPGAGTAPPGAGPGEKLPPVTALDVVAVCIGQLHEIAWAQMGLVPNPVSQTIQRDLTDARLAIDCVADLVRHLEKAGDPSLQRELQNMLSNLRLNFVQQSQKS
jgi:Domain of unknown function (DUF1844)